MGAQFVICTDRVKILGDDLYPSRDKAPLISTECTICVWIHRKQCGGIISHTDSRKRRQVMSCSPRWIRGGSWLHARRSCGMVQRRHTRELAEAGIIRKYSR